MSAVDQSSSPIEDMTSKVVAATIHEDEETPKAVQDGLPFSICSVKSKESDDTQLVNQPEMSNTDDPPATNAKDQPPPSPVMDLETDFPTGEKLDNSRVSILQLLIVWRATTPKINLLSVYIVKK